MDKNRGGRVGRRAVMGVGLALAFGVAGLLAPAPAGAQAPGPGRGYYSVPDRGRPDEHRFRRDDWRHDRFRRDDWRRDAFRPYRPYHRPVVPYPVYRPGQWLWNGWGWVWVPGYRGY